MNKSPVLITLIVVAILLSSIQLAILFMFNGKINQLKNGVKSTFDP